MFFTSSFPHPHFALKRTPQLFKGISSAQVPGKQKAFCSEFVPWIFRQ